MIETVPVPGSAGGAAGAALVLELMPVPDVLDAVDVLIAPGLKTDRASLPPQPPDRVQATPSARMPIVDRRVSIQRRYPRLREPDNATK